MRNLITTALLQHVMDRPTKTTRPPSLNPSAAKKREAITQRHQKYGSFMSRLGAAYRRSPFAKSKITDTKIFAVGVLGGLFVALFRIHVEARGDTFYDFIEKKGAWERWEIISDEQKKEILVRKGREDLLWTVSGIKSEELVS